MGSFSSGRKVFPKALADLPLYSSGPELGYSPIPGPSLMALHGLGAATLPALAPTTAPPQWLLAVPPASGPLYELFPLSGVVFY
jgi:hypothetical protein